MSNVYIPGKIIEFEQIRKKAIKEGKSIFLNITINYYQAKTQHIIIKFTRNYAFLYGYNTQCSTNTHFHPSIELAGILEY